MKIIQQYKPVGEFRHYDLCRFCFSKKLTPAINLGYVPLAGGFLTSQKSFADEQFYPLEIGFCENCYLLQSTNVIDKDTLFKNYFYHSSAIKTLTNHFTEVAQELQHAVQKNSKPFIVEIGCNDGTLIRELTKRNVTALGIDPATNIVEPLIKKGLPIINNYFTETLAKQISKQYGKADIICSFNVLAHIEDMHDVVKGIKVLLKNDGMLLFETHYLGNLLNEIQYDMIYHEHQYYYSLITLQKFFDMYDMEIFDVKPKPIHAGSMRYYVKHKNSTQYLISQNIKRLVAKEKQQQLHKLKTYTSCNKKISQTKHDLLTLLKSLKKQKKTIAGYGASGRGTIIMNYCGLDETYLDYMIDDAPAKQDAFTPGNHLKIRSSEILSTKERPDYVVLFAWSFLEEIKKKNKKYLETGGKFILPLPKVTVI